MYRATVTVEGISPYSQSRQHRTEFLDGESHEAYELRTWRNKTNADLEGIIYIPAMAFKQALDVAAKRLAIPDPDNRKANFTKYFVSDVLCETNMNIGVHKDDAVQVWINANVDGVRGSGKRVMRAFPQVMPPWFGTTSFLIMEPKITYEIFEKVLKAAGQSIGIGQFRPANGGLNGRFQIRKIIYEQYEAGDYDYEVVHVAPPKRMRERLGDQI